MLTPESLARLNALGREGLRRHVPLAPYTSFRIGGPAEYLLVIHRLDHLTAALSALHQAQTSFLLLGGGSNVLISDAGVPGLTIINQCKSISWPEHSQHKEQIMSVTVESGAPLAGFARESIHRGFANLSWAVSIPGSVGGAIVGNAGAHGGDIAKSLLRVQVWRAGRTEVWPAAELAFTYRGSRLKRPSDTASSVVVILSATFRLEPDEGGRAQEQARAFLQHRRRTQPTEKSAGSIFKNPPGDYAGRLIDLAGLKGYCIGDACISEKHANFIINRGGASAADVMRLMNLARQVVWRRFGLLLEPEIVPIGDWSQGPSLIDPRKPNRNLFPSQS